MDRSSSATTVMVGYAVNVSRKNTPIRNLFKFLTQPEISWSCPSCVDENQAFGNSKSTSLSNTLTTFMSKMDKGMSLLLNQVGLKADKSDLDELQQKLENTNTVLAEVRGEVATLKKQRNKTTEDTLSMTIAEHGV